MNGSGNGSRMRIALATAVIVSSVLCSTAWGQASVWTERDPTVGSANWFGVASSSDGTKLVAVDFGGYVYTSTNSGVDWTKREPAGAGVTKDWYGVASSSNGERLVAVANGGKLYTSPDYGASWAASGNNRNWYGVASSSNGEKLVVVHNGGKIYISDDYGGSWTGRASPKS